MDELEKEKIIEQSWLAHALVEQSYLSNPAVVGDKDWQEKQRILLADMALHLLQTALASDELNTDKLKNNLYSILTISEQFLPEAKLADAKRHIY